MSASEGVLPLAIDSRQNATILAALRFYQQNGMGNTTLEDIATNGGAFAALDDGEIDALIQCVSCEAILPTAVIEMDCGAIHCVRTSIPMRVVLLDSDTEGGDKENLVKVNGQLIYLHDYKQTIAAEQGGQGVNAEFVSDVLAQIDGSENDDVAV